MVVAGRHSASTRQASSARAPLKRKGFRRVAIWLVAGAALLVIGLVAQTAFAAFWVSRDATALQGMITQTQTAFAEGRISEAAASVDSIVDVAARLKDQTGDATWTRAQRLPVIGSSFTALGVLSGATFDVASAAQPVAHRLQGVSGAGAGLAALNGSAADLRHLQQVLIEATAKVNALPTSGLLLGTDRAVVKAQESLDPLAEGAGEAARMADLLPGIVGGAEPSQWLVLLQNPAESRGSGGLFSAFALVEFADGTPRIVEAASRKSALDQSTIPYLEVADPGTVALWGTDLADWASFNLSSDFPTIARLAAAGMAKRGTPVQGVLAIDPTAVGALLKGTGPVEHKGVKIDADQAAPFFTRDIYTKFPDFPDVAAKDELVMGLLYATADSLLQRPLAVKDLWTSMQDAVDGGHVKAWSADPDVEQWFMDHPVDGQVRQEPGSDVVLNLNNGTGGKIDAYVTGKADYEVAQCMVDNAGAAPAVQSTVTLALENQAPTDLPPYVDLRLDNTSRPKGSTKLFVHVYGPQGATATLATLDGNPVAMSQGIEAGRPVWGVPVELGRGETHTIALTLNEPQVSSSEPQLHAAPTGGGIVTSARNTKSSEPCPVLPVSGAELTPELPAASG
jgi:hypothetical protein